MKRTWREKLHDVLYRWGPKPLLRRITSCEEITKRVSVGQSGGLRQQLATSFHLVICQACVNYQQHLNAMSKGYRDLKEAHAGSVTPEKIDKLVGKFTSKPKG